MAKTKVVQEVEDLDFLEDNAGEGYDEAKSSIPRIVILQANPAGQYIEGSDEYIPGAKPGYFFLTSTKEVYKEPQFIPIMARRAWLEWIPQENGGGFRGKHRPNSLQIIGDLYKGAKALNGNDIVEALEIYGLIPGKEADGPILLSLTNSSIKYGDLWVDKNKTVRTPKGNIPPIYGSVWVLKTGLNKNKKGQWFSIGVDKSPLVERKRWITKKEYMEYVKPTLEYLETAIPFIEDRDPGQVALPAPQEEEVPF